MEVALQQINLLEDKLDDFIRLEESWNTVKASVVCAVTGMKGVFRLMDPSILQENPKSPSSRSSSIASAGGAVFRRLSSAFSASGPPSGRSNSVASGGGGSGYTTRANSVSFVAPVYRTPNYVRNTVNAGFNSSLPPNGDFNHHKLSTIPQTPAAFTDDQTDPFDNSVPPVPEITDFVMSTTLNVESRRGSLTVV